MLYEFVLGDSFSSKQNFLANSIVFSNPGGARADKGKTTL